MPRRLRDAGPRWFVAPLQNRRFPAAAAFDPIRPPRAPAPPRRLAATWSRALVGGRGGGQGGRVLRQQHRAGQEELGPTRSRAQEEETGGGRGGRWRNERWGASMRGERNARAPGL